MVTLVLEVTEAQQDHRVPRVSLDFRAPSAVLVIKVNLVTMDLLDRKDLWVDLANQVS